MVEQLAAWYARHRQSLEARGIDVGFERSPEDGRPKASAWVTVQRGATAGEIIVWDSGECELLGPLREDEAAGTDPRAEHRELETENDLLAALARLLSIFN